MKTKCETKSTSKLGSKLEGGVGGTVDELLSESQTDWTVLTKAAQSLYELVGPDAHVGYRGCSACIQHTLPAMVRVHPKHHTIINHATH